MTEPLMGKFYDCETGESVERELTQEEIDALPQNSDNWPAQ